MVETVGERNSQQEQEVKTSRLTTLVQEDVNKDLISKKTMLLREQGQGDLSGKFCVEVKEL